MLRKSKIWSCDSRIEILRMMLSWILIFIAIMVTWKVSIHYRCDRKLILSHFCNKHSIFSKLFNLILSSLSCQQTLDSCEYSLFKMSRRFWTVAAINQRTTYACLKYHRCNLLEQIVKSFELETPVCGYYAHRGTVYVVQNTRYNTLSTSIHCIYWRNSGYEKWNKGSWKSFENDTVCTSAA